MNKQESDFNKFCVKFWYDFCAKNRNSDKIPNYNYEKEYNRACDFMRETNPDNFKNREFKFNE